MMVVLKFTISLSLSLTQIHHFCTPHGFSRISTAFSGRCFVFFAIFFEFRIPVVCMEGRKKKSCRIHAIRGSSKKNDCREHLEKKNSSKRHSSKRHFSTRHFSKRHFSTRHFSSGAKVPSLTRTQEKSSGRKRRKTRLQRSDRPI